MKVLHIIDSLARGGAEQLLVTLLPELVRQGDEVSVAVLRGPLHLRAELEAKGIVVHVLPARYKWSLPLIARDIAGLVKKFDFQVIHAHLFFPSVATALCRTLKTASFTSVVSFHNLAYLPGVNKPGLGFWLRRALPILLYPKGFDACMAVSEAVRQHYGSELRLKNIEVLHNPIDLDLIRGIQSANHEAAKSAVHLVVPGRLVHEKGHIDFLHALQALCARRPIDVQVTFAGGGPLEEMLKLEIAALSLEDRVTITGQLEHSTMLELMARADMVVVPSRFEGFGITALEAMALGKPVVATTAGGLPEVIEEGKTGLLVAPRDVEALADAIEHLLEDAALRHAMSKAGPLRAAANFSLPVIAEQLRSTYARAMRKRLRF